MSIRRERRFPGPRSWPLIGNPWAVTRDPLQGLQNLARTHGDVAEFWVGRRRVVYVGDPAIIEDLLVRRRDATIKDPVTRELSNVLGNGLVTSDGAHWKKQRRAIAPSFRPRQLEGYAAAMVRSAEECMPANGESDVHVAMSKATLHIVIRTIFGAEPTDEAGSVGVLVERLMDAFITEQRTGWRFMPKWVPASHRREVERTRAELDTVIFGLIERARHETTGDSLLARLLAARDDAGGGMTDTELRDELVTLFLAGHETTSLWLSFAIWMLAEHPEIQDRVQAELDASLSGPPGPDVLRKLPYLDAVLQETLRLYPPVWAIAREAVVPIDLGRGLLDPGDKVVFSMWTLHRDPRFWVGPERFRPQRWLNGETDHLPRAAFLPFSDGARVCIGNHFAKMEAGIVLASLLQRKRIHPMPGYAPEFVASVTLRPANGVRVLIADRE